MIFAVYPPFNDVTSALIQNGCGPLPQGIVAGDENGLVASTTNMTRAFRSVVPLLETSIGMPGPCPGTDLPGIDMAHAMRALWPLSAQYIERFGAWMRMYWRLDPGRWARVVDAQQILGSSNRGIGPISATLLPPADDPPCGPSVKSQTFPATSAVGEGNPS